MNRKVPSTVEEIVANCSFRRGAVTSDNHLTTHMLDAIVINLSYRTVSLSDRKCMEGRCYSTHILLAPSMAIASPPHTYFGFNSSTRYPGLCDSCAKYITYRYAGSNHCGSNIISVIIYKYIYTDACAHTCMMTLCDPCIRRPFPLLLMPHTYLSIGKRENITYKSSTDIPPAVPLPRRVLLDFTFKISESIHAIRFSERRKH